MKSNLITKIIVTCLCMWAIGMAADQNQEIKSINEGVKTQAKVEANVELQKKIALKEKAIMQADIKAEQKATLYQNAKKEATIQAERKANAYKYDKKVAATQAERKANAYKYDKKVNATQAELYQALQAQGYPHKLIEKALEATRPDADFTPTNTFEVAPQNGSRDGSVSALITSTDSWNSEVYWILLDTQNWWAWGDCGWCTGVDAYGSTEFTASVPAGNYLFILADSYGDGGATADISVNGDYVGSVATAGGDPMSPYSGLYEASFGFDVGDAAGCADGEFDCGADGSPYGQCIYGSWACDGLADCNDGSDEADCGGGNSIVNFEIDTPDDCAWVCLLYTSPSPRDRQNSRKTSSA